LPENFSPIAAQPSKTFFADKDNKLSERSEFLLSLQKMFREGSRRPSCRADFLLLLFFFRKRKVSKKSRC